ncbi:Uncharacterised protein (plasmid) [Tsukamurella tyrosinosolvens]|uniref:Uncharacterized protein n=1 Tax=Tsukamurella tyrosinosolvens TaxID=57704 RepID=A0A1H4UXH1_TSUTY|nr:hypothetical protein [Tsukamurella tyrosinosolvens]KXO98412.1 hypothetical protein AXK58_25400 [Tsukamurella tyrosinosolvens]SEC73343.1 hypothetical protein SAMN04489793_3069 [Tsukamurella tyrosinosolvens]VEH90823.1 Uncharacterised protein [Tsukamurella tyrosinosolvens]
MSTTLLILAGCSELVIDCTRLDEPQDGWEVPLLSRVEAQEFADLIHRHRVGGASFDSDGTLLIDYEGGVEIFRPNANGEYRISGWEWMRDAPDLDYRAIAVCTGNGEVTLESTGEHVASYGDEVSMRANLLAAGYRLFYGGPNAQTGKMMVFPV